MITENVISFMGWAGLTYLWLESNCLFFSTVVNYLLRKKEAHVEHCGASNDFLLEALNILNGKTCGIEFLVDENVLCCGLLGKVLQV